MAASRRISSGLFGAIGRERFLRDYWRSRPLLVRGAIANLGPPLQREALLQLARRDDVEARLVTRFKGRWQLKHAPLARLPAARRDWTLLVQGANLHYRHLDHLMRSLALVPLTRLDDLMVSFAVDGGGVGPHFDSYDVFLIQAQGQRRWRIGDAADRALVPGLPLKILRHFVPQQEWILEPGDMLYLPPHVAHDGVAIGECMTYSVGFRAPTFAALGREFLLQLADDLTLPGRFSDATRAPTRHPARLDRHLLSSVERHLDGIRWSRADVRRFVGRYFSEPKAHVFFTAPAPITPARFAARAARRGLTLALASRLFYDADSVFINGEHRRVDRSSAPVLADLADHGCLSAQACGRLDGHDELSAVLHQWYLAGWIRIGGMDE